ncbi:MAG: SDR family oxidoreductase, partial [Synergistes sp.]|nr:SDR family oxidoreductase [Synergistes sp.]
KLDAMPLTPNGKINRKALPMPEIRRRIDGLKPAAKDEIFFVQTFASVLGLEESDVYADDNFFRIGGTSISAMKVLIAANNAGYKLIYADVFNNPTPQALAKCAASKGECSQTSDIPAAPRAESSSIDLLLERNTLDSFRSDKKIPLGRVLLCGATGYTGIHVLRELLENTDSDVTCLVRSKRGTDPERRLASLCFYYFSEDLTKKYAGRLIVAEGDVTKRESLSDITGIDTVINCAANVKHFSAENDIEEINYNGVLNLIDYCKTTGVRLVQTSTLSVSGMVDAKSNAVLTEQKLNIGQITEDNKYVSSKYKAEEAILTAICEGEIEAKIMRLGNLSPRYADGKFQINFESNASMGRIKNHFMLGCYPYEFYDAEYEMSPIDSTARAIVLLSQTPRDSTVFHICNTNKISFGDLLSFADEAGLKMKPVKSEEYKQVLSERIKDPEHMAEFPWVIAYASDSEGMRFAGTDET